MPKRLLKKDLAGPKFRRYRILFFVCFSIFFVSWILELIFFGAASRQVALTGASFGALFFLPAAWEGGWYLLSYLLGVTVYAPAFAAVSCALRGFFSGYVFSCLAHSLSGRQSAFAFFFCSAYLFVSAFLFCVWSAFSTDVALRLFTDRPAHPSSGERRMIGGTLFNSTFFADTINLRFLFSYTVLFLAAVLCSLALLALYVFALTRL